MYYPDFTDHGDTPCSQTDPDAFFPDESQENVRIRSAKAIEICNTCPYKDRCLAWAMANREEGIWGGTTTQDRRRLRRRGIQSARTVPSLTFTVK